MIMNTSLILINHLIDSLAAECLLTFYILFFAVYGVLINRIHINTFSDSSIAQISFGLLLVCTFSTFFVLNDSSYFAPWFFITASSTMSKRITLILATLVYFVVLKTSNLYETQIRQFSSLYFMAILGSLLILSSSNFVSLYAGIELQALALYSIVALLDKKDSRVVEASLKYYFIGVIASICFLAGTAFLYSDIGALGFSEVFAITNALAAAKVDPSTSHTFGALFVVFTFLIKLGVAPYHLWSLDGTEGSSLPSSISISIFPKFVYMVQLLTVIKIFGGKFDFQVLFISLGLITIVTSFICALGQNQVKRFYIYTSLSQVGFSMLGLSTIAALNNGADVLAFLVSYLLTSVAFWLLYFIVAKQLNHNTINEGWIPMDMWQDLARKNIFLGFVISIVFFSFSGIPLMAGFIFKFVMIESFFSNQSAMLVVFAVFLMSAVSAYYYIRFIKTLYFEPISKNNFAELNNDFLYSVESMVLYTLTLLNLYLFVDSDWLLEACKVIVSKGFIS